MSEIRSTGSADEREAAVAAAAEAIQRGELIVLPTDTVYGIAADAFDPAAVQLLLEAKGRGRDMPPPVLVASAATADSLMAKMPRHARALTKQFWPGPLTLVGHQQQSLRWDLGDTRGTVAVRVPDDEVARELLQRTGPLAVSSANVSGEPAATTAEQAHAQLGDAVSLYIDDGARDGANEASTIIDVTGERPRMLRLGALSIAELNEVLDPLEAGLTDPAEDREGQE